MPVAFLDTNALLKLYVPEIGSNWLQNFVGSQQIAISELALFEVATVLRRRYIEGGFTRDEAIDLFGQILLGSAGYQVIPLGGDLQLNRLFSLIFNLPISLRLRSLDSIQLTAADIALETANNQSPPEPFTFISSDKQLLQVAQSQGFVIENPEDYP